MLRRTVERKVLSGRARTILQHIVSVDHERIRGNPILAISLTDVELLRRAAKVEPPLSFHVLRTRYRGCGAVTAREICEAMGLPVHPGKLTGNAQCPRCGHVFGGGK
jgi:hypothetical protein